MKWIESRWYQQKIGWLILGRPLTSLFEYLARQKKQKDLGNQWQPSIPLIVVGNISVGGTGKSPLVISLIRLLQEVGYRPGVVSRGYGAKAQVFPHRVAVDDLASICGDEPIMIHRRTRVPVVIDPNRVAACKRLIETTDCDIILSDDGLQHYGMGRDIEIVVIDAAKGLGNGYCLPIGPLRERAERLSSVDYVVVNGTTDVDYPKMTQMQIKPEGWYRITDNQFITLSDFAELTQNKKVKAIAGIGAPERFFNTLAHLGIESENQSFADHYQYRRQDFLHSADEIICMTEKDAVKCFDIAPKNSFYLVVSAQLSEQFARDITQHISQISQSKMREL